METGFVMTIPPFISDDPVAVVFAQWCAQPFESRDPDNIQDMARKLTESMCEDVTPTRLINLYNQVWWVDFVESTTGGWTPGFSRWTTDQVIEAVARKATKGDMPAARTYLQMAGVFDPRTGPGKIEKAEEIDPGEVPVAELEKITGSKLWDVEDED